MLRNDVTSLRIAKKYDLTEKIMEIENELMGIRYITDVEWDLSSFVEEDLYFQEIIVLPKYEVPVSLPDYYEVKRETKKAILDTLTFYRLRRTADRIEDHGEHWYIVMTPAEPWETGLQEPEEEL